MSTASTRSLVVTAAVVVETWACSCSLLKLDKFGLAIWPLADNFSPQYGFDNIRNNITRKFNILSIIDLYLVTTRCKVMIIQLYEHFFP
jgi:hypothetical protein